MTGLTLCLDHLLGLHFSCIARDLFCVLPCHVQHVWVMDDDAAAVDNFLDPHHQILAHE